MLAPSTATYTVQDGDTLSSIAEQAGFTPEAWLAANPGQGGEYLTVGQIVQVPAATSP